MKKTSDKFTIIDGGKDELERKKTLLFNQPESFNQNEFEHLCEMHKLNLAEIENLIARRVQHRVKDSLERDALLAIIGDDHEEADRLLDAMERRHKLGLSVISSSE